MKVVEKIWSCGKKRKEKTISIRNSKADKAKNPKEGFSKIWAPVRYSKSFWMFHKTSYTWNLLKEPRNRPRREWEIYKLQKLIIGTANRFYYN